MLVSCQADPHTDADAANDPALMAIRCVGAEHPGAISSSRRRVLVSLRCHQQIICRFGVPNRIIIDNISQFTSGAF
jgi:hypothetical protein